MTVIQFLRLWESYHQVLNVAQQQKLANHVSLVEILTYRNQEIMEFLPENPKLTQLMEKLQDKRINSAEIILGSDMGQAKDNYESPCLEPRITATTCTAFANNPSTSSTF